MDEMIYWMTEHQRPLHHKLQQVTELHYKFLTWP